MHLAIAELLKRGHKVAVPVVDDDGVDLVVDYHVKVQVKSANTSVSTGTVWRFGIGGGYYRKNGELISYRGTDPDILMAYAHPIHTWWICPFQWLYDTGLMRREGVVSVSLGARNGTRGAPISRACLNAWHLLGNN